MALHDDDTSEDRYDVRHTIHQGTFSGTAAAQHVRVTDDDNGEALVGPRPADAVWWAALTARRETGGYVGHIDYTSPHADTGKLSNASFAYGGTARKIDGLMIDSQGDLQLWVDSGGGPTLPNSWVFHVGDESFSLGSATRQSFYTLHHTGTMEMRRDHTYEWSSAAHDVSLGDRDVVAVWLEEGGVNGRSLPGKPAQVKAAPRNGGAHLEWVAPAEVPNKPVLHYEYQQEGTEGVGANGRPADERRGVEPHQRRNLQVPVAGGEPGRQEFGVGAVATGHSTGRSTGVIAARGAVCFGA